MTFDRTGIILYTINYHECVIFYRDILQLDILFTAENLTCFSLGQSYLMVELDDEFTGEETQSNRTKVCLRMNVPDVKSWADKFISKGISVDYQVHEWGTVAKFRDPDGNLLAFKDSEKFEKQILNH